MFHWICPECGREIAPQAKECAACDPLAAAAAVAEVPAPLQARVPGAPKEPASAVPVPAPTAGQDLTPVTTAPARAQTPEWQRLLPEPQPARAPQIANTPLRDPQPATPSVRPVPDLAAGPELGSTATTALPDIKSVVPGPPLAPLANYAKIAAAKIAPSTAKAKPLARSVQEQISLPGPTLPHELTSLSAAGIAQVLVAGDQQVAAGRRGSSWMLSFTVAAAILAGTLSVVFYAMPGLASSPAPKKAATPVTKDVPEPPKPALPANPLARVVEVAGIRFVTDIPGQSPQIHYLVVNHGNLPLVGLTVNVTLRSGADADSPLSQFAFRAPRLAPYESKEMVSSIQGFNRAVALPDWRDLRAEIQIAQ